MRIDVTHHFADEHEPKWFLALMARLNLLEKKLMTTVNDAVGAAATAAGEKFASIEGSLVNLSGDLAQQAAEIQSLKDLLAAGNVISPEAQAALDGVVAGADRVAAAAAALAEIVKAPSEAPVVEPTV